MEKHFVNEIIENIWKDRYQKNQESYEGGLRRVANHCAKYAEEAEMFFNIMNENKFFPAGRTMSNSGIGRDLTLNNCFVAPQIKDDLKDIFNCVKLGAKTHQKGGGIGYDFSNLRPSGTPTSNDAIASGPVSFMDVFNAQTATILQGGRRGANMGVMNVYHPDIEEFINAKSYESGKLNHFNVSVMVDDDFIHAVENDEEVYLHYPVYDEYGKILNDDTKWSIKKKIKAKYIWDLIMKKAYDNGEPGVFFYNNLNNDNNLAYIENIVCSNPCAEYLAGTVYGNSPVTGEPIDSNMYGGACNLGSVMLHNFVLNPFTENARLDYKELEKAIRVAVRYLDNIIDINEFPDDIYKNYQKAFRTIGLGVTGLADMLVMLNMKYNCQEARDFVFDLMNRFAKEAYRASIELAKERGSFPFFVAEKFVKSGYLTKHAEIDSDWQDIIDDILVYGIRNSKILSVAPTGTMSLTFGNNCSSGIEPIFSLSYERKVKMGGQDDSCIRIVSMEDYAYHLWKQIPDSEKIVSRDKFITAMEMSVDDHVDMLANIAWNIDMSCSKTINVPSDYSFEDTKEIYMKAWKYGIKGCTIFRPNEIRGGILIADSEKNKQEVKESQFDKIVPVSRKTLGVTSGNTFCKKTACGTLYITINRDKDGNIVECFVHTSKGGICQANINAVNRMVSLSMRSGVKIDEIIDQLRGITCQACARLAATGTKLNGISCPDIIARTISEFKEMGSALTHESTVEEQHAVAKDDTTDLTPTPYSKDAVCPECGSKLRREGGCMICIGDETHTGCGYSKCD